VDTVLEVLPCFSPLTLRAAQEMLGNISPKVSAPQISRGFGRKSSALDTETGLTLCWVALGLY